MRGMTALECSSRVQNGITTAVKSANTCTDETVNYLRRLLNNDGYLKSQNGASRQRDSKKTTAAAVAKKRSPTTVDIYEDQDISLSAKERLVLATAVVNAVLQTLGDAVKTQNVVPLTTDSCDVKPKSNPRGRETSSKGKKPFKSKRIVQEVSSNRSSTPPGVVDPKQRNQGIVCSTRPLQSEGTERIVECARIAFEYLRAASPVDHTQIPHEWHIEHGMVAFIGKLVSLRFGNVAAKELKSLKRRLEIRMDLSIHGNTITNAVEGSLKPSFDTSKRETLATLLHFETAKLPDSMIPLIISYQVLIIRTIGISLRPQAIESLKEYVSLSCSQSPVNLINRCARLAGGTNRAALLLEQLSQILLSLCPILSPSNDADAIDDSKCPSPETCLWLQSLALHTRMNWMALSGHTGQIKADILAQYQRSLAAFLRRSPKITQKSYSRAKSTFDQLLAGLAELHNNTEAHLSMSSETAEIYRLFSHLAERSSLYQDAQRWIELLLAQNTTRSISSIEQCNLACRIAILNLNHSMKNSEPIDLDNCQRALSRLATPVIGTAEEMTNMICTILSLRKAASNYINANSDVSTSKCNTEHPVGKKTCRNIVSSCILLQYELYKATTGGDYQCEASQAQLRKQLIFKSARSSIETVAYSCSRVVATEKEEWATEDKTLRSCVGLVYAMEDDAPKDYTPDRLHDTKSPSLLVILSNAFFKLYVNTREAFPDQSLCSLQESCDTLSRASTAQKQDGNLLSKIERLAKSLRNSGRHRAARDAYLAYFKTWCEMRRSDNCTATGPKLLPAIWKDEPQLRFLVEALRFLLEFEARSPLGLPYGRLFVDDESISEDDRSTLLEWQLGLVSANVTSKSLSPYAFKMMPPLMILLYELYGEQTHYLQRKRVSLQVLNLASDTPGCIPLHVLTLAEECAASGTDRESHWSNGTGEISPCLKLCLAIALLFRGSPESENRLENAVSLCSQVVQSSNRRSEFLSPIDDIDLLLQRLSSLSDFLGSKGRPYLQLSVARLAFTLYEHSLQDSVQGFVKAAIKFGLELLRLGYSELAGVYFAKARDQIFSLQPCDEESLDYHLAYAEYFLDLGDRSHCREHLVLAESLSEKLLQLSRSEQAFSRHSKIFAVTRNADLLHLQSRLHFLSGSLIKAFWFAKRKVTVLQSVWKSFESRFQSSTEQNKQTESDGQELVSAFTNLDISERGSTNTNTESSTNYGPKFWPLAPRLFRALLHLAELYEHSGLLGDATYNLDQALRLAEGTNANHALAMTLIRKGDCAGLSGSMKASWDYLDRARKIFGDSIQIKDSAVLQKSIGRFHRLKEQWKTEIDAYDLAESILTKLVQPSFVRHVEGKFDSGDNSRNLSVSTKSSNVPSKKQPRTRNGKPRQTSKLNLAIQPQTAEPYFLFTKLHNDLMRLKAESLLLQGELDASAKLISRFNNDPVDLVVEQRICQCRQLVYEATIALSADGIFAMVAESAISFPGAALSAEKFHCERSVNSDSLVIENRLQKHTQSRAKLNAQSNTVENFRQLLNQALQGLSMKRAAADQICNLSVLRQAAATVASASMMLSSVMSAQVDLPLHPTSVGYSTDLPQSIASLRDQAVTCVENIQKHSHQKVTLREDLDLTENLSQPGISELNKNFIDSLPASWTIVSISLDESRNHLHLTRYRRNQSAFVLRLPLDRQNTEDPDEESFTFAEARSELSEIVALSDATVHAAREKSDGMRKKSAKAQWWAEREELDSRMHDFLLNIENMWLGGFRGIFSQHQQNPHLLARFQQSFEMILEKHLPSRQSSRKRPAGANIKLDPQVLDLFVGLANSLEGIDDLDETLTDLLYFVVDILQFNGEANAYDEVDFDSIIIDTQGALRSYYEASKTEPSTDLPQHTILVLDKQLHGFPWESLPCLDGASVSRLYSLIEIRERLFSMQQQKHSTSGIYASSKRGTAILNPSSDLKKTQSRFERVLSSLSHSPNDWTSIINRVPTEDEFANALYKCQEATFDNSSNEIFLYFGHGSGAQYIRHRRIKQLRFEHHISSPSITISSSCSSTNENISSEKDYTHPNPNISTALLFGCSSASLRENLEFEPHGTPKSYMLAGAPALLGSLWDVTDGDVDKFAGGVLERWGLVERGTFAELREEGAKARSKGRAGKGKTNLQEQSSVQDNDDKTADLSQNRQTMSLTEAVAKSRGDCYLRYLNGSAMVVYGVPVYLAQE